MNNKHKEEVLNKDRFEFGGNWENFLATINDEKINKATTSLKKNLNVENLSGRTFLDIGSGSGLSSLAAKKLGAKVTAFDYDPKSVACTMELRKRFFQSDKDWHVFEGSILDEKLIDNLETCDIVYSWGVLHHTGAMWQGIENATKLVSDKGKLFIAIYNYQPFFSKAFLKLKKLYINSPKSIKFIIAALYFILAAMVQLFRSIKRPGDSNPLGRAGERGMNLWHDSIDWVGGYPFEVATPEEIVTFINNKGFLLEKITTVGGGQGCNQFIFKKITQSH